MKVKVARIYHEQDSTSGNFEAGFFYKKGGLDTIKGVIDSFCCEDMEYHFGSNMIGFGEYNGWRNTNDKLNIYVYAGWECYGEWEIAFCPFCGEAIEYVEKGE